MADPNALYSYQGQEPKPLPHEISWVEEWGQTTFRTGVETFTEEEVKKAGYEGPLGPEINPSYDPETQSLTWNSEKLVWEVVKRDYPDPGGILLRQHRDYLLASTDWTQLSDNNLTDEQKLLYAEYRQKLRDLPSNIQNYYNIDWPEKPSFSIETSTDIPLSE